MLQIGQLLPAFRKAIVLRGGEGSFVQGFDDYGCVLCAEGSLGVIILEHGPLGQPALFEAPRAVLRAWTLAEVISVLDQAEALRAKGAWIAGWLGYEAGYAFEARLMELGVGQNAPSEHGAMPLLVLGVYDGPAPDSGAKIERLMQSAGPAKITVPEPLVTQAEHSAAIGQVLEYIRAGDCYQINLTFPLSAKGEGDALSLYAALRAGGAAGHGALVDMGDGIALISASPELFFSLDPAGRITARPMKGTRPRDKDPIRDQALAEDLAASPKDRAENLMIVDLLRNDIARLSRPGSVKVPDLFTVEHYPTVHQMTSTVCADLSAPASLSGLMQALFPCGSITGAPKIRAMQIIHQLEPYARGAYCGAIGWMAPDGRADFSVAIRTLQMQGEDIRLNVGGGVVYDSTAAGEWEEALWKTRFIQPLLSQG